ncbi:potassium transporter, partial [Erwinia amylovora]|nr:potassium transporter [Erwinia amylovora]
AFTQTFVMALMSGTLIWWPNRKMKSELKPREGLVIVVLLWTGLGRVGARPCLIAVPPTRTQTVGNDEACDALKTTRETTVVRL